MTTDKPLFIISLPDVETAERLRWVLQKATDTIREYDANGFGDGLLVELSELGKALGKLGVGA